MSKILTRGEFSARLSCVTYGISDDIESDERELLDHDSALRAEIKRLHLALEQIRSLSGYGGGAFYDALGIVDHAFGNGLEPPKDTYGEND
jgi:hypothetical protein